MKFIDLNAQYKALQVEVNQNIQTVLNSGEFILGPQVEELEEKLADYVGVQHCITCANGTDALSLALMVYDVKVGDAVFIPTFTFYATAETVSLRGATPIFVDIDKCTFNLSAEKLEEAIKRVLKEGILQAKAIIAVDLFGLPADFDKIRKIAEKYELDLIEDGAQGFGGSINDKRACSFGDIATTSFFPAKPLGCYGDGGALFTNDDKLSALIKSLRVHGKGKDKYDNIRVGLNSRLDTLQAAILLPKLKAFKEYELIDRNAVAQKYHEGLKDILVPPYIPNGYISSYAQYSILLESTQQRDFVQAKLSENEIPTMIYYRKSMHEQSVYNQNPSIGWGFPAAEEASSKILNLPIHPYLTQENQSIIIEAVIKAL